jgi:hypothetical protein
VTTHPRIFAPPSTLEQACHQVDVWLGSQGVVLLSEQTEYWGVLRGTIVPSHSVGPRVHDARVAALCAHHGVRVLWSADRDFSRYPSLNVVNPLKNE